jgi:hypothetical protein
VLDGAFVRLHVPHGVVGVLADVVAALPLAREHAALILVPDVVPVLLVPLDVLRAEYTQKKKG